MKASTNPNCRPEIVLNLTDFQFSTTEMEALNIPTILITHIPITIPPNKHNNLLDHKLTKLGIPIILTTSHQLLKRTNNAIISHAGIYSIPCKDCDKHYIDETQRNLEKKIYEHKRSIKLNDDRNALFSHMLDLKHTFHFSQDTFIKPIHCQKTPQTNRISSHFPKKHIKHRPGFYKISPHLAVIMLYEDNDKKRMYFKNSLVKSF